MLTGLLPDLMNNILNLYSRAWTFTDDKLPPLAFSHSAVRFGKLLSDIYLHNGILDDILLRHLVLNASVPVMGPPFPVRSAFTTKGEIVDVLFRAYPRPPSEPSLHIADYTEILAGIASVLNELRYHRKKALVLKDLMTGLLPALVQARKDGAAEMGVHPAASLASLNATIKPIQDNKALSNGNDAEQGIRYFFSFVCQAYGIAPKESTVTIAKRNSARDVQETPEPSAITDYATFSKATALQVLQQASCKSTGSQDLKIDILRACISLCEALPDLGGALQYSAELLRVGGSGIAPGPESSDGSPDISIEEQLRLMNNISRTLSAARHLGFEHPEAEYWDDFLVRGIEVIDSHTCRRLQQHAKSELEVVEATEVKKEKNPFIYNPFLKSQKSFAAEPLLVAQEEALFQITLQNLYDFDVVVERASLVSDGISFVCEAQATMIGPYRTQTILVSGSPKAPGNLNIYGCTVKIRGCRERDFATFPHPWSLKPDVKGRHRNIDLNGESAVHTSDVGKKKLQETPKAPVPSTLTLTVLRAQPNIILKSSSLSQSAVMLLEGESKTFTITLRNTSHNAPVDLLLLSFEDSISSQRLSRLTSKELSATELYELEISSAHKQPLQWLRSTEDRDLRIDPDREVSVTIEVLGKSGLSHCSVHVDYAYLGFPKKDIKDRFYTRQLVIPLNVTVNPSIDIVRNDFVALPKGFSASEPRRRDHDTPNLENPDTFLNNLNLNFSIPHCLLLIDFHNSWPNPLTINFALSFSSTSPPTTHTQPILPGATERIPFPLPRIHLPNPYAPIPSLNPAHKRQFVVSATKTSPETERTTRETFWYRENLLSHLSASWKEESTGRTGMIDVRKLRLTPQMLNIYRLPDLDINMSITNAENPSPSPSSSPSSINRSIQKVKQTSPTHYTVPTTAFLTLITTLHNRSPHPIRPLLRLQPTLAHQPQASALDISKKLMVNGVLQRALPVLGKGERREVETEFLVLGRGSYEWRGSVEEVGGEGGRGEGEGGKKEGLAEGDVDGLGEGEGERRMWVAEEACVVVARDDEGD